MAGRFFSAGRFRAIPSGAAARALRGVLLLGLVGSACGKDSSTGPARDTVGPGGGVLEFAGGSVALLFPPGAVSQSVTVTVQPTTQYPNNPRVVPGTVYDFQPAGLRFTAPVLLGIEYNSSAVPRGVPRAELTIGRVVGSGWSEVASSPVDSSGHFAVIGAIDGLGVYGVMALPVASVAVSPARATIVFGQTLPLKATATSTAGDTLTRAVTWSSSNPAVVAVDTGGVITALDDGSAIISARSDTAVGRAAISAVVLHFVSVTTGGQISCGLTTSGDVFCWGQGQIQMPILVSSGLNFSSLDVGQDHTCGVTVSAAAYCFGAVGDGQLGNGSSTSNGPLTPVLVAGGLTWTSVSAGFAHSCGVTADGSAYCWGNNFAGALGNGSTANSATPVPVSGGLKFLAVDAGAYFSCGVAVNGRGYCWGNNAVGKLGDSTTQDHAVPTPIVGGLVVRTISAGGLYACAVTTGDHAYCWGYNASGALGDGTTTDRNYPAPVSGGLTFLTISADNAHTCGVTLDSSAYCWGDNQVGELGIGSRDLQFPSQHPDPLAVLGGLLFRAVNTSVSPVAAHSCGITTGNVAYCWGDYVTLPLRVLGQR